MEMILLPILAFLGLVFLVDTGTDDDLDTTPAPEINPDLNRQSFGAEDDITTSTDVTDFLFLNDGDDMASGGAGDDTFYADGGDALIGGTEADDFSDPEATAVAIDDFDPATEQLNIDVSLALDAVPTITYEIAAGGSGTNLLVDGNVVAFLVGVDPSTLNAVNVTNTNVTP